MIYDESDMLPLSGLQHIAYCKRQWALIHIEQQWHDNFFTVSGSIMHDCVHDQEKDTKSSGVITSRGVKVSSPTLGIYGVCDALEYHSDKNGISLNGLPGKYRVVPIEYKRGKPKAHDADEIQLTAQAMCFEYMLSCNIDIGFLYYGEAKHRTEVLFGDELKNRVKELSKEMHILYKKGLTPKATKSKKCSGCSMYDICLPESVKLIDVSDYINTAFNYDNS